MQRKVATAEANLSAKNNEIQAKGKKNKRSSNKYFILTICLFTIENLILFGIILPTLIAEAKLGLSISSVLLTIMLNLSVFIIALIVRKIDVQYCSGDSQGTLLFEIY